MNKHNVKQRHITKVIDEVARERKRQRDEHLRKVERLRSIKKNRGL